MLSERSANAGMQILGQQFNGPAEPQLMPGRYLGTTDDQVWRACLRAALLLCDAYCASESPSWHREVHVLRSS
jgi:hypothetical protein